MLPLCIPFSITGFYGAYIFMKLTTEQLTEIAQEVQSQEIAIEVFPQMTNK